MTAHMDQASVQELKSIMGNEFGKLVQTFASDSTLRIDTIRQAAAAADSDALRRAAHSFKGSSGNMGAQHLSDLCRQIEELARDGNVAACDPLIAALVDENTLVQKELEQF